MEVILLGLVWGLWFAVKDRSNEEEQKEPDRAYEAFQRYQAAKREYCEALREYQKYGGEDEVNKR